MKTARITQEHKTNYVLLDGDRELTGTVRGSFFVGDMFPKVGDFVVYDDVSEGKAVIEEILPRTSVVARKAADNTTQQVIVANVDIIFIVMGLDKDFNLSRLERYLLLAQQSGVESVVILNKRDSVDDHSGYVSQVKEVSGVTSVYAVSALSGEGMESLTKHLSQEKTAVLLGSSGAGKSTITNWLLREDKQQINSVRENDSRGKHTTTSRHLFAVPTGGYLIDTPGMRELNISEGTAENEELVFAALDTISRNCRFSNCDHEKSEGCAIIIALNSGDVSERQFKNYQKLQTERLLQKAKHDKELSREQKQKQKKLSKSYKNAQQKKLSSGQY